MQTESRIDAEVTKLVNDAYDLCYNTIKENQPLMDAVVDSLLENETIDGSEMFELVAKFTGQEPKKMPDLANAPISNSLMFYSFGPEKDPVECARGAKCTASMDTTAQL